MTWKQTRLGLIGEAQPEFPERFVAVDGIYHQGAALAQGAGGCHMLSTHREWTSQGERGHVWFRSSLDGESWSQPIELSRAGPTLMTFPALAAAGQRIHALWIEVDQGWANLCYRGSLDGGRIWSNPIIVSKPREPTAFLTTQGFRKCANHFFASNISEDGHGNAHVVWAASSLDGWTGEPWHTTVHLNAGPRSANGTETRNGTNGTKN
jgi:hypothetical protein